MTTVDTHHHFWDLTRPEYSWIKPLHGVLHRDFGPDDLSPLLDGIDATVLVQAANSEGETELLLAHADKLPWIGAVVGWVDVEHPFPALDRFAAHPKFRGIRHLVQMSTQDPDWLVRPSVHNGLRLLAERGLSFDVGAEFPRLLPQLLVLAEAVPELTIVLNHLAKPPLDSPREFNAWAQLITQVASHPNIVAKVSGMNTITHYNEWTAVPLTASLVRPAIQHALECFGADRLMFGSNWPVLLSAGDEYSDVVAAIRAAIPADAAGAIFGGTAQRVYGIAS